LPPHSPYKFLLCTTRYIFVLKFDLFHFQPPQTFLSTMDEYVKEAPRIVPVTEPLVSPWVLINHLDFCMSPVQFILTSRNLDDGVSYHTFCVHGMLK
jgi:hypothetical protein